MNKVKVFKENFEVGGLKIPADFKCITTEFINKFSSLSYNGRVNAVCSLIADKTPSFIDFNGLKNVEFPASIIALYDNLAVVELFDGENANYQDYISNDFNGLVKISSIISLILSVYVDLIESNFVDKGEKINFSLPSNDGLLVLSTYIAMKIGVPINAVIVGGNGLKNYQNNGLYAYNVTNNEVNDYAYDFFYDYDYVLDLISTKALVATDYYLEENEGVFTVIFSLISPYFDSSNLVSAIFNKKNVSESKSISIIYDETAIEIPSAITNKIIDFKTILNNVVDFENFIKFM